MDYQEKSQPVCPDKGLGPAAGLSNVTIVVKAVGDQSEILPKNRNLLAKKIQMEILKLKSLKLTQ